MATIAKKQTPATKATSKKATAKKHGPAKKSSKRTSAATKVASSNTFAAKTAAPNKLATKSSTTKGQKESSAARKLVPTKKQISHARAALTDVRAQEKKLAKELDRHTTNLRDLKHDLKTTQKDVTKVEKKLDKSKRSRQQAQKMLRSLQS